LTVRIAAAKVIFYGDILLSLTIYKANKLFIFDIQKTVPRDILL